MILFQEDWQTDGQPNAFVHGETKNKSFLRTALVLKKMGIENHLFPLALHNPVLANYDPHDLKDPSEELRMLIAHECEINGWYFLREVIRIPTPGNPKGIPFEAHRGNIALSWCFFNGITYIAIQCRQTGKTIGIIALSAWLMYFSTRNYQQGMITKDETLRTDNVKRLKLMGELLPDYLVLETPRDRANKHGLVYGQFENEYKAYVGPADKEGADRVGRGSTMAFVHFDEFGFIRNISTIMTAAIPATSAAKESAIEAGMPYGKMYSTTGAHLDSASGRFANDFVKEAMPMSEKLYDCKNVEEAKEIISKSSTNNAINGTFSYLQLGKSHDWVKELIRDMGNPPQDQIDRELLNIFSSGSQSSLLDKDTIRRMKQAERADPNWTEVTEEGYVINWYVPENEVKNPSFKKKSCFMAMDSSENIGKDFTAFTLVDAATMTVLATVRINEANLIIVGQFIGHFLLKYERTIFIPERKSTGATIIDSVILILLGAGVNPLTRIFNNIIQEKDSPAYRDLNIHQIPRIDLESGGNIRRSMGFKTDQPKRNVLFGEVMRNAVNHWWDRINDPLIVSELAALSIVKGRVDHKHDGHDDAAISWLIACWVAFNGRNLHLYNFDSSVLLSEASSRLVSDSENTDTPLTAQQQNQLKKYIETKMERLQELRTLQAAEIVPVHRFRYEGQIEKIKMDLEKCKAVHRELYVRIEKAQKLSIDQAKRTPDLSTHMPMMKQTNFAGLTQFFNA